MVTFAQAQERGERWINGDIPAYQHRDVRVREFDLGFVVWAEDREDGPASDGSRARLVIARDSEKVTLWPGLPVEEVIQRYEKGYGTVGGSSAAVADAPPKRIDLEVTSFLLTPPQWLQDAADQMGIPDQRSGSEPEPRPAAGSAPEPGTGPGTSGGIASRDVPPGAGSPSVPASWPGSGSGAGAAAAYEPTPRNGVPAGPTGSAGGAPTASTEGTLWADANAQGDGEDRSVQPPATVFAPPLAGSDDAPHPPNVRPEAGTELMPGGSRLPPTALASSIDNLAGPAGAPGPAGPGAPGTPPQPPGTPGAPGVQPHPDAGAADIADAATARASRGPGAPGGGAPPAPGTPGARGSVPNPPPPPGAPGTPGTRGSVPNPPPPPGSAEAGASPTPGARAASGTPAGGYVPTQLVSALPADSPSGPGGGAPAAGTSAPDTPGSPGEPAANDPNPPGIPGQPGAAPQPPGRPGQPGTPPGAPAEPGQPGGPGGVHSAATMLAGTPGAPPVHGAPQPPGVPAPPGQPGAGVVNPPHPHGAPGAAQPPAGPGIPPGAYGYPQAPTGQPMVGPGYMAVLRYRAHDGSEQQVIRRSAPGIPHPEWQIFHELRAMGVPPQQVLELHTELEPCELPGGYCARMIRETWPQVRLSHTASYGRDHATRRQGVQHLVEHQGELHQVADGPARPAPNRVPLPHPSQVQRVPPVPVEGVAHELLQSFGPHGVFRFDQRAVARQGVPEVVAQTLVWAGLPVDFGPFFWGQAQPGRPVPTLAELAAERQVQPASDANSYLVMGSDFGRQLCVQYGTAHIVAVPLEAGPGGQPVPPQFVNTGLPEFVRCMALLGRMWRLRYGLTPEQAGRWTVDFQAQLAGLDPAALSSPENWWAVLLEQMWDGLL